MSVKFFGQFLLERNKLTARQLLEAVSYQESRNLKFGDYARKLGYLTALDVNKLNDEQKRTDMLIGELSVKMGLLKRPHVDEVLTMQKNDHILLGEAIVEKGFLSGDEVHQELLKFKEDQKVYDLGDIPVPDGIRDSGTVKSMVDLTGKLLRRVAKLDTKIGETAMSDKGPDTKQYALVSVRFTAGALFTYALCVSREVAVSIATGVIGMSARGESDAMLLDSVKEFCNIVCGNVMAGLARKGKTVDISPPEAVEFKGGEYPAFYGYRAAMYPLANTTGDVTLYVMEG
jgi:CheY-specific phosphatase CheX